MAVPESTILSLEDMIENHECCEKFTILPDKLVVSFPHNHVPNHCTVRIQDGNKLKALKTLWTCIESHKASEKEFREEQKKNTKLRGGTDGNNS